MGTEVTWGIETPTDMKIKMKDMSEKIPDEKVSPKQTSYNLPIPEHANDWMEVIESGGFSLDDEEEELEDETKKNTKDSTDSVKETKKENEKQKSASFNLPI